MTVENDLNAVITSAVQARIEAAVAKAMSGDEVFASWITAALNQKVEIPDPDRSYGKIKVPWIRDVIFKTIRKATKQAVVDAVAADSERIQKEVAKAVRAQSSGLATMLVEGLQKTVESDYRTSVDVKIEARPEND